MTPEEEPGEGSQDSEPLLVQAGSLTLKLQPAMFVQSEDGEFELHIDKPGLKVDLTFTKTTDEAGDVQVNFSLNSEIDMEALLLGMFPGLQAQYDELDTLTPHLFPIVVGALVDAQMGELIAAMLIEGKDTRSLLGAEGLTYVQRVRLTIALGLLPEHVGKAAMQVGRIRNHFAHKPKASILDPEVKPELTKLVDELVRTLLKDMYASDPIALNEAVKEAKKHLEADTEEIGRLALKTSWLILSSLIESARRQVTRLIPLEPKVPQEEALSDDLSEPPTPTKVPEA